MNEQTEQLIRELADKFGTTTEYLWEVMIRQASITAVINTIITAMLVVMLHWAYKFVVRKTTKPEATDETYYPCADWEEEPAFGAWMLLIIAGIISVVGVLDMSAETITCLLNPEYWALKQLIPR